MKILAQGPTQVSAVATILLITKTFTVKYYDRRRESETEREREREREREYVRVYTFASFPLGFVCLIWLLIFWGVTVCGKTNTKTLTGPLKSAGRALVPLTCSAKRFRASATVASSL